MSLLLVISLNRCDYKLYEMRYSGKGGEVCSWKDWFFGYRENGEFIKEDVEKIV